MTRNGFNISLPKQAKHLEKLYSRPWSRFNLRCKKAKWFRAHKLQSKRISREDLP